VTEDLIQYHLTITFFQKGLPLYGEHNYDCEKWEHVQNTWQGVVNNPSVTSCWITLTRECRGLNEEGEVCSYESDSEILLMYKKDNE
jgi:hypothetical protein